MTEPWNLQKFIENRQFCAEMSYLAVSISKLSQVRIPLDPPNMAFLRYQIFLHNFTIQKVGNTALQHDETLGRGLRLSL